MNEQTWFKYRHAQGYETWHIAATLAAAMPLTAVLTEEERKITPRQIASFACDIAQALVSELDHRGWIEWCEHPEHKPPPTP